MGQCFLNPALSANWVYPVNTVEMPFCKHGNAYCAWCYGERTQVDPSALYAHPPGAPMSVLCPQGLGQLCCHGIGNMGDGCDECNKLDEAARFKKKAKAGQQVFAEGMGLAQPLWAWERKSGEFTNFE